MNTLYNATATFCFFYTLNMWIFDRTGESAIDVITFGASLEYVSLYSLTFGAIVALVSYWMFYEVSKSTTGTTWSDNIPTLWVSLDGATNSQRTAWKIGVFFIVIIFPLFANAHFWNRFEAWDAWDNCNATQYDQIVDKWSYPSTSFVKDCDFWDAYRYGDFQKRTVEKHGGISFVPLVEPVICVALSVGMFAFSLFIAFTLFFRHKRSKA